MGDSFPGDGPLRTPSWHFQDITLVVDMRLRRVWDNGRLAILSLIVLLACHTAVAGTFEAADSREVRQIRAKIRAAQFLSKATFGPTQSDIDTLGSRIAQIGYRRACSEWLDLQFSLPATKHRDKIDEIFAADTPILPTDSGFGVTRVRYQAWWDVALRSEDQLRQRVAWALSQIFVTSDEGAGFNNTDPDFSGLASWFGPTNYYDDVLVDNAFGSYRALLSDMTFSPIMGTYLSHLRNRKADVANQRFPDENYAREIMQLFSIGLYKLEKDGRLARTLEGELIPSYDNEEIKTLARLFTGFKYENDNNNIYGPTNLNAPMEIYAPEHDNNIGYSEEPGAPANKEIFGTVLPALPVNPTEQQVIAEIEAGLDVLFNHPNVAPFISRLMIQRLVKSNPSRGYIRRVARKFESNENGERGDLKAVVRAILLDPEAVRGQRLLRKRSPLRVEVVPRGAEQSRLREPILRVTSMIRALKPSSDYKGTPLMMLRTVDNNFGQSPYRSPSVFNFYLPDFQPPGGLAEFHASRRNPHDALYAPEFQILDAVTANRSVNQFQNWVRSRYIRTNLYTGNVCQIDLNLDDEYNLVRNISNLPQYLEQLDLLLCNGSLSETTKDYIIAAMEANAEGTSDWHTEIRTEETLLAVLLSPDCAIEE
jgi:uncharacterized protein (DUF1800 family)